MEDVNVDPQVFVAAAIDCRTAAEKEESKASPYRWQEADSYAELSALGWTQQEIATACGTNRSTVSRFIACVVRYSTLHTRPPFWEAYAEITGEKTTAERLVSSESSEWYTPAHRKISECIESVIPNDRTFTTQDIMAALEALDGGRVWRKRSVDNHISRLRDRVLVHRELEL